MNWIKKKVPENSDASSLWVCKKCGSKSWYFGTAKHVKDEKCLGCSTLKIKRNNPKPFRIRRK